MIHNKFTTHYKNIIQNAYSHVFKLSGQKINIEHIIFALMNEHGSLGSEILQKNILTEKALKKALIGFNDIKKESKKPPIFDKEVLKVIKQSVLISYQYGHQYIGTEHLLSALINHKKLQKFTKENQRQKLSNQLLASLKSTSKFAEITNSFEFTDDDFNDEKLQKEDNENQILNLPTKSKATDSLLYQVTRNLTDPKVQESIDPVIGREKEIERLIHILSRRTKNNPILLGDPGVGKTAIIEGLAKKITQHEVPYILANKEILTLDLASLLSGTMYRGEFEQRLKQLLDELRQSPNTILFIDEIHTIMGAGATSGSMDAANILKPALARGQVRCIGATTFDEYKKHIEKDPAFERRFQAIHIYEPSLEKTIDILKGVKGKYEQFHSVLIPNETIQEAVHLSDRYITNRFLPDKALDILDEAAAQVSIKHHNSKLIKDLHLIQDQLKDLKEQKHSLLIKEFYDEALATQMLEQKLIHELILLKKRITKQQVEKAVEVTKEDVLNSLRAKINVPINDTSSIKTQIKKLDTSLKKHIAGQPEAIKHICNHLQKSHAGIRNPNKPIASFVFLGPSGVGKTELAKALAIEHFGHRNNMIRIDMSEFTESHSISKLVGSPAGYVGYREGTLLTDKIRQKPYSLVLFDEIEKAHPQVINILLQILDDGYLTDSVGKKSDFKHAIIILTSNTDHNNTEIGFDQKNTKINTHTQSKELLSPMIKGEIINRIDQLIYFKPLDFKNLKKVAKIQIVQLNERLKNQQSKLTLSNDVLEFLTKKTLQYNQGARGMRKTIEEYIELPLSEKIINDSSIKSTIKLKLKDSQIIFE